MKKMLTSVALSSVMFMASATDVGLQVGGSDVGSNKALVGVSVVQPLGNKFSAGLTASRTEPTAGPTSFGSDRVGAYLGYDALKVGSVTVTPKVGVARINTKVSGPFEWLSRDGNAVTAGVGASMPLSKSTKLAVDYQYTKGQDKIKFVNGSSVFATVSYAF